MNIDYKDLERAATLLRSVPRTHRNANNIGAYRRVAAVLMELAEMKAPSCGEADLIDHNSPQYLATAVVTTDDVANTLKELGYNDEQKNVETVLEYLDGDQMEDELMETAKNVIADAINDAIEEGDEELSSK